MLGGSVFAPLSYFLIGSVPLTAVGVSGVMIGFTCIALANARPLISPEASRLLLRTGIENTAALLEELGVNRRAIYLPSSLTDGGRWALVPLTQDENVRLGQRRLPGRLIVRYGDAPEAMGIAVRTPGGMDFQQMQVRLGPTLAEMEAAINHVLAGILDLASSAAVAQAGSQLTVVITGARLHSENVWYYRCLGSPLASIVAGVCCEALGKPVCIKDETRQRGKDVITLEVLP